MPESTRGWRLGAWLLIFGVVFVRNSNAFLHPILFGEDGTHLFMYYMENRGPGSLLREYAGYVSFAANAMGWLIGTLPILAQPFVLAANAGLVAVMCFWLFSSPRFANVLPSTAMRCVACVAMAISPMGNFALTTCTMFVNWHLLFAASILALAAPPRTRSGRAAEFGFVWLCLWTNPVSIVLLPIYLWRAIRTTNPPGASALVARIQFATYAALTLAYQLLFVGSGSVNDTAGSSTSNATPLGVLDASIELGTHRVMTEPFLGSLGRFEIDMAVPLGLFLPGLVVLLFIAARFRDLSVPARGWVIGSAAMALGMTVAVAFARFDDVPGMMHWGHRYTYVQKFVVYLAVVVVLANTVRRPVLLAACILAHATLLGLIDSRAYRTRQVTGERLMKFMATAAEWRANPSASGSEMVHSDGSLHIVVRKDPAAAPR